MLQVLANSSQCTFLVRKQPLGSDASEGGALGVTPFLYNFCTSGCHSQNIQANLIHVPMFCKIPANDKLVRIESLLIEGK